LPWMRKLTVALLSCQTALKIMGASAGPSSEVFVFIDKMSGVKKVILYLLY
jgi:hypothetical protein